MHLKKIALLNFKNMAQEELTLCPGINCLVGDNGAGKTNVVDAVYYLSMCKSSLQMTDAQSIRHGADFFLVEGQYATDAGKSEGVVCSFSRKGGKVLKRNGKEYDRLSDHVGLIPAVIVSPADSALISDAADERRRYLNAFISQLDRPYLNSVMRYNAVLAERNRLLKMRPDETMLQIYDMQLCEHGKAIHARRQEFAERLQPVAAEYYRILSGDREQVELHYKSELNDRPFEEVLLAARQKDLVNEFTTAGIHRSSRPYYIELALGHDALYVHAGGSPEAYQDLKSWKVNNIDGVNGSASQSAVFWRDQERRKTMDYEHTLVTSGEKIQSFWDGSKYAKTHGDGYTYSQTFTDEPLTGGATAEHVKLAYTSYKTGLFDYDAATGRYLVSQYQAPYVDGNTGEQVSAVNLLLLETNISVISGDKEGRLKVRTTGEGDGLLCRNGQSVPIHWRRADRNSHFVYTTADGQPLALGRGNSYVCIMDPKTSKVECS